MAGLELGKHEGQKSLVLLPFMSRWQCSLRGKNLDLGWPWLAGRQNRCPEEGARTCLREVGPGVLGEIMTFHFAGERELGGWEWSKLSRATWPEASTRRYLLHFFLSPSKSHFDKQGLQESVTASFSSHRFASLAACFTLQSTVEFDSGKWWHVGFIVFVFSLKHNVHILQPTHDTRFSKITRSQYDWNTEVSSQLHKWL